MGKYFTCARLKKKYAALLINSLFVRFALSIFCTISTFAHGSRIVINMHPVSYSSRYVRVQCLILWK